MTLSPQTRDLAQRLLAYEGAAGKNSGPTEPAAFRVCEKLRHPLCALAGVAGFRSLLSRALTLARAEAPSLSAVQIAADGSLQGLGPQKGEDRDQAMEGGAIGDRLAVYQGLITGIPEHLNRPGRKEEPSRGPKSKSKG